jgi:hypothetical protein
MEFSLKKGSVNTPVTYIDDFCNDLYAKNILLKIDDANRQITLSLDYSHMYSQKPTNYQNGYDEIQLFEEHLPYLYTIQLYNEFYIIRKLAAILQKKHIGYQWKIELVLSKSHIIDLKNIEIKNNDINLTFVP